uniref:von Willebrand factor type A domain-containing protein n=1 Tax=Candidatus Kentrum sp. SD TaxID=2126332 RepID=A0A450YPU9_9GAMM|nr:MAG: von Willebrand factor type A domain-containing protein [Candidatus Kentron sp. SD]VFK49045.1 MAG: von Willebrand factor type A domain-containing protein [Candidatus Kentron sp. SD]
MRRLPVFLVLDVSDSMVGEPRRLLEKGIETLIQLLRQDPHALETAYISVIAFAGKVETLTPLTDVISFYPPQLPLGSGTAMGLALEHLMKEIDQSVRRGSSERKGDWKPAVFFMTDGKPTYSHDISAKNNERLALQPGFIFALCPPLQDIEDCLPWKKRGEIQALA